MICRNEISAPPLVDWRFKAGGVFGLGLAGSKVTTATLSQYLKISGLGFSLNRNDPHLDLDHYDRVYLALSITL